MLDLSKPWPLVVDRSNALFIVLGLIALIVVVYQLDASSSLWMQAWPSLARRAFRAITDLGDSSWILIPALVLLIVGFAAALFLRDHPRLATIEAAQIAAFIFVGVGTPGLIATIVKRLIGRGRPGTFEDVGALDFRNFFNDSVYQSFPSGHATTIFALCFVLSFLLPRLFPWMLTVALLVCLSRIVVGVHYATDVTGGVLVGTLGAYAVRNFFAARGWLFEIRSDGSIGLKPLSGLAGLSPRRP
jgi:membrane-associated phospholipid phosphatase